MQFNINKDKIVSKKFRGFRSPAYTITPDELYDELLSQLNGSELKVLLYIVRRTFGFKKKSDNISTNQIMNGIKTKDGRRLDTGTGLSNRAVINAVKTLEAKNIIIANRRIDKEKGNLPTRYSLNILPPYEKTSQGGSEESSQGLMKKLHTQNIVLQDIDNNVKVTQYPKKPEYEIKDLINQMEQELQDNHSRAFYKKIAERYLSEIIYQALSITKDMDHQKQIKKSKAAFFTGLIKKMAEENGIKTV